MPAIIRKDVVLGPQPNTNLTLKGTFGKIADFVSVLDYSQTELFNVDYTGSVYTSAVYGIGSASSTNLKIYPNNSTFVDSNTGRIILKERVVFNETWSIIGSTYIFGFFFVDSIFSCQGTYTMGPTTSDFSFAAVSDARTIRYQTAQLITASPTFVANTIIQPVAGITDTFGFFMGFQSQINYQGNLSTAVTATPTAVSGYTSDSQLSMLSGSHASAAVVVPKLDGYSAFTASGVAAFVHVNNQCTATLMSGLRVTNPTKGATGVITTLVGLELEAITSGATTVGVRSAIAAAASRWFIQSTGTGNSAIAGMVTLGDSSTVPTASLTLVSGQTNHLRMAGFTSDPASPTPGDFWYQTTRKHQMVNNAVGTAALTMCVNVATSDSTPIASTATETAFSAPFTFPANSLTLGRSIRAVWSGVVSTTLNPTMQFRIRYGAAITGVLLIDFGAVPAGTTVTNVPWRLEFRGITRTIGATGTIACDAILFVDNGATTLVTGTAIAQSTNSTATIDTTTATALNLTATWSANSASNTITRVNQHIEVWN